MKENYINRKYVKAAYVIGRSTSESEKKEVHDFLHKKFVMGDSSVKEPEVLRESVDLVKQEKPKPKVTHFDANKGLTLDASKEDQPIKEWKPNVL